MFAKKNTTKKWNGCGFEIRLQGWRILIFCVSLDFTMPSQGFDPCFEKVKKEVKIAGR